MKSLVNALARLTKDKLQKLIESIPTEDDRVARLKRKRDKVANALAKLDRQIAQLTGGNGAAAAPARRGRKPGRKKGYTLSAETRRKMSEAAKRRYAGKGNAEAPAPAKKRRTMSPETRAKMAAAAKARWAKKKDATSEAPASS
jgi:hypothetical protein